MIKKLILSFLLAYPILTATTKNLQDQEDFKKSCLIDLIKDNFYKENHTVYGELKISSKEYNFSTSNVYDNYTLNNNSGNIMHSHYGADEYFRKIFFQNKDPKKDSEIKEMIADLKLLECQDSVVLFKPSSQKSDPIIIYSVFYKPTFFENIKNFLFG